MSEVRPKKHYDAFISYRRASADGHARAICDALDKRGLNAYLDVNDKNKKIFDETLLERIREAPNFIVVLSPNCLDRCNQEGDWLRREIACAVSSNRHIVPVFSPKFSFPPEPELPEEIRSLPRYDGVPYSHELFDGMIDKLVEMMERPQRGLWTRREFLIPVAAVLLLGISGYFVTLYNRAASLQRRQQELQLETHQQQLQQENSLMGDARAAEVRNDWASARDDYEKVIRVNGDRSMEARASLDAVKQKLSGASDEEVAQRAFTNGAAAFRRGEYTVAKTEFEQVLARSPQNSTQRPQASDYLQRSESRIQQEQHLEQAQSYFNEKKYDAAQGEAEQVISVRDGDPGTARKARDLLARISQSGVSAVPLNRPAPEIVALTNDAEGLIGQGRYKEAWSKADAIEQLKGDASSVRHEIQNAEETKYQELARRYVNTNRQSRPELLNLKTSFEQFASDAQVKKSEANDYVALIEREIAALERTNAIPPVVTPGGTGAADGEAAVIQSRLNEYAEGVASGDIEKVKAVRQLRGNEEKKMIESLKATKGKGYVLRNCSPPEITGDNARVSCDALLTLDKETPSRRVTFFLKRIYGQWFILLSN